ncbi:putative metal-binding protein [Burkholderiales bacterium JOSHI_001]|nr:putative metal-binding protein [Burkholderiales bacterium JOSHI_001]
MATRELDPLHLDIARLAAEDGLLHGQWSGESLPRLLESQSLAPTAAAAAVGWRARGERRSVQGGVTQTWLHLELNTTVTLTCQRCLQPLPVTLAVTPSIRFVAGDKQAEAEDADSEEDVLALTRSLDLRELAEDELLLALPLVPRHASCPSPLPQNPDEVVEPPEGESVVVNPFAALAALKKPTSGA